LKFLIRDKVIDYLDICGLIKNTQHVKNKSCSTNLLVFMEKITNYVNYAYLVDIIYLEFKKAFDIISDKRLVQKIICTWH